MRLAWDRVRARREEVPWAPFVWHTQRVPKHAIFVWRALRGRITTHDQLRHRGFTIVSSCVLRGRAHEDADHLFLACSFSRRIWEDVLRRLGVPILSEPTLLREVERLDKEARSRTRKEERAWIRLGACAVVYELWMERNARTFENVRADWRIVLGRVAQAMRAKGIRPRNTNLAPGSIEEFMSVWRTSA